MRSKTRFGHHGSRTPPGHHRHGQLRVVWCHGAGTRRITMHKLVSALHTRYVFRSRAPHREPTRGPHRPQGADRCRRAVVRRSPAAQSTVLCRAHHAACAARNASGAGWSSSSGSGGGV
eukprot:7379996-Prymnesium_polylepis.2